MARTVEVFRLTAIDNARLEAETAAGRKAEIERLERHTKDNARARVRTVTSGLADALSRVTQGDLSVRLDTAFFEESEGLRHDFNRAVDQLAQTFSAVSTAVGTMNNGTWELASGADNLASRTEHQAASLEQTAAYLPVDWDQRVHASNGRTPCPHGSSFGRPA
ncbi:methyl-accepting chemotaxis protein [Nguyenibacter vanlangensis]|uniref:Methyl-accepting chemotaxis protein n=1 Tax=Nguyenibacter vanlangensis TaxID=1216886 RepID=A0A7Y7M418_9PROT|nr:methyl-accepting chemotaxis protein [Nguyenibacter vanlangensis]NVN10285.1 methyl-accepting chemotaxis protein [Nguyenibacter vanlangensis]